MNQMTSYQVEAFGRPLAQVVRDIPTPQGREVVIKVGSCGVCHSDVHLRMQNSDGLELVELLSNKGVPCAPILDVPQALKHPHTAHRAMTVSMPGGYKGMASPIKLSRTPATYRLPPPADC